MALIPTENPMALWGYYCGCIGLFPVLGAVLGPVALYLGIRGVRDAQADPEIEGRGHAVVAIVLGSIATLLNYGAGLLLLVSILST